MEAFVSRMDDLSNYRSIYVATSRRDLGDISERRNSATCAQKTAEHGQCRVHWAMRVL